MQPIPKTVEEAIQRFCDTLKQNLEVRIAAVGEDAEEFVTQHHFGALMGLRNEWKMWDMDGDLNKDFQKNFGLCHGDDLSGIIVRGGLAMYRNENYVAVVQAEAERYKAHWRRINIDPCTMKPLAQK